MVTSLGTMRFALTPERTPITVANFLAYVDEGFFDGLVFHRVIETFMVQGGGFDAAMHRKAPSFGPIVLETGGLPHARGTIAMARTSAPDSATSQFFVNTRAERRRGAGGRCFDRGRKNERESSRSDRPSVRPSRGIRRALVPGDVHASS